MAPGDRIIKINGQSTEKFNLEDAVRRLRGKPGTDVTVTIFRPATEQEQELKLTRDIIKVASVRDQNGRGDRQAEQGLDHGNHPEERDAPAGALLEGDVPDCMEHRTAQHQRNRHRGHRSIVGDSLP